MTLNAKQEQAAKHFYGPLLVLAGAGTGKTKTLISRIVNLSNEFEEPHKILAVTFTNKATREMKERLEASIGPNPVHVHTFHSLCLRLLKEFYEEAGLEKNFVIIDQSEKEKIIKECMKELDIDTEEINAKSVSFMISSLKDNGIDFSDAAKVTSHTRNNKYVAKIYTSYQGKLANYHSVDFDDLIFKTVQMLNSKESVQGIIRSRFNFILVDEYQDVSNLQDNFLHLITDKHQNICCVGDEDQAIYGWRGANVSNILNFDKVFKNAAIIRLEQNYRSTDKIIASAMSVIKNNKNRHEKHIFSESQSQDKVELSRHENHFDENRYICHKIQQLKRVHCPSEIAILVRAFYQTRVLEEALNKEGIAYDIVDGTKFYDRKEIKDLIAYLRIVFSFNDVTAFDRIVNEPKRGVGAKTIEKIRYAMSSESLNIVAATDFAVDFGGIGKSVGNKLKDLTSDIRRWHKLTAEGNMSVEGMIKNILEESGYLNMIANIEDADESRQRQENIKEFIGIAKQFDNIDDLLGHIALVNSKESEEDNDAIKILTMHASKGLEYDAVILPHWEEGIFPSPRSLNESGDNGEEEERRLAYVAMTRARQKLFITMAKSRYMFGRVQENLKSRFVEEVRKNTSSDHISTKNIDSSEAMHEELQARRAYSSDKFGSSFNGKSFNQGYKSKAYLEKKAEEKAIEKPILPVGEHVKHKTLGTGTIENIMDNYYHVRLHSDNTKRLIHKNFVDKI